MGLNTVETIAAVATPAGEGGIGIIRLSGPESERLLGLYFQSSRKFDRFHSHRLYHGRFLDTSGQVVDEVMAVIMRQPYSYTREDVVEIHCHGGMVVQRRILENLIDGGARLAKPGEFTLRAFLNGRIDLAEAEAVIDVIRSRSEAACNVALDQLSGKLSRLVFHFRDVLIDLLAEVEADIDFPEEEIDLGGKEDLQRKGKHLVEKMSTLLDSFESGRVLKEGLGILIFGKPNVGKSSLMNALLGEARTIVTEIPGTTRDTIEERLVLGGIPLRLVDTAGVRETSDPVENEGVKRALGKVAVSDLVLLVIDGSKAVDKDDFFALEACKDSRVLLVINKKDLGISEIPEAFKQLSSVSVSTLKNEGLEKIEEHICHVFRGDRGVDTRESVVISDIRHRQAVVRAMNAVQCFLNGIGNGIAPELHALDLREALEALGEITGETTPGTILENIFSRFCIGK